MIKLGGLIASLLITTFGYTAHADDYVEAEMPVGVVYSLDVHDAQAFLGSMTKYWDSIFLSEEKRVVKRLGLTSDLDTSEMIVFAPAGPVKDYINVFTDITCGYCRKLHLEIDDLNRRGIEVRYLAYPRDGPDSQGASLLATAWCSKNRQAALTRMKSGVELPINNCADNPIAKHFALGNKLGIWGTPAIVTSSGMMIPGYRPAADLAQMIGVE